MATGLTWLRDPPVARACARADTGAFRGMTRSAEGITSHARLVPAAAAGLAPLPFQGGLIAGIAEQPVQLEVFDSPRTLASAWSALLRAAAFDALAVRTETTPGWAARDFVDQVRRATRARADEDGTRRSPYVELTCLSWRDRVVHAVATNPRHELVSA